MTTINHLLLLVCVFEANFLVYSWRAGAEGGAAAVQPGLPALQPRASGGGYGRGYRALPRHAGGEAAAEAHTRGGGHVPCFVRRQLRHALPPGRGLPGTHHAVNRQRSQQACTPQTSATVLSFTNACCSIAHVKQTPDIAEAPLTVARRSRRPAVGRTLQPNG